MKKAGAKSKETGIKNKENVTVKEQVNSITQSVQSFDEKLKLLETTNNKSKSTTSAAQDTTTVSTERNAWHLLHTTSINRTECVTSVTHHQYQQDGMRDICYTTTSINRTVDICYTPPVSTGLKICHLFSINRTENISYTTTSINRTENMTSVTQPPVSTERNAWHLLHTTSIMRDINTPVSTGRNADIC